MHLTAPGIDVAGVSLPFAPGITIGHNERIAWGFTNVGGDTQDLYLERLNDDGTAALYDGAWEPLTTFDEEIAVRGRDEPEVVRARETRHGPILDSYLLGTTRRVRRRGRDHRDVRAAVRRARGGHPAVHHVGAEHGRLVGRVPRGAARLALSRAERGLRRRRRPHRLPVHGPASGTPRRRRHGAGPGLDRRARVGRVGSLRRAAVGARPRRRLPGDREQPAARRLVPVAARQGLPAGAPRAAHRPADRRAAHARRGQPRQHPDGHASRSRRGSCCRCCSRTEPETDRQRDALARAGGVGRRPRGGLGRRRRCTRSGT